MESDIRRICVDYDENEEFDDEMNDEDNEFGEVAQI